MKTLQRENVEAGNIRREEFYNHCEKLFGSLNRYKRKHLFKYLTAGSASIKISLNAVRTWFEFI